MIAQATVIIERQETSSKFAILKLIEYLEKEGLLGLTIKIEVLE